MEIHKLWAIEKLRSGKIDDKLILEVKNKYKI